MMNRPVLITLLAILDLVFGAFWLLAALSGVFSIATGKLGGVEVALFVFFGILGVLTVVAGIGLLRMKEYGRIVQLGLSVIGLLGIPIGTIISALILYYFTRPGVKVLFSGRRLDQLSAEEIGAVQQLQSPGGAVVVIAVAVGLLVIIAFTGIIAAIAIPNLLTAMQRAKQKRTIVDMRSIAAAWESRATDCNSFSLNAGTDDERLDPLVSSDSVVLRPSARIDPEELAKVLTPTYARAGIPRLDGWEREIELYVGSGGQEYAIRSLGKDGTPEGDVYREEGTRHFDCDIVLTVGKFVSYPEGLPVGD